MASTDISQQMREEWNERARDDAYYYVAFAGKGQQEEEFFATAADVVRGLELELKRLGPGASGSRRALEIGCGPGRLMRPMSRHFGEIHGVDVSDEMIRLAKEKLRDVPHAFPTHTDGAGLAFYADASFDFVYSYAVFQHIPSRDVVLRYLLEARRVLKTGAILRCQINGLPPTAKQYTTWEGVRMSAAEVAEFAAANDFQLLALEGVHTQYMWVTLRKRPAGWFGALAQNPPRASAKVRNIFNAYTGEPIAPSSGRFAALTIWMERAPDDCDLNQINVAVDGAQAAPTYLGPLLPDGLTQLKATMPPRTRTGLVPVDLFWFGERLCPTAWLRVTPAGPALPRLNAISDAVNLLGGTTISSRTVKLFFEGLAAPERLQVGVDGNAVGDLDFFCVDPADERFEVNFRLPDSVAVGPHNIELRLGARVFPPIGVHVAG